MRTRLNLYGVYIRNSDSGRSHFIPISNSRYTNLINVCIQTTVYQSSFNIIIGE